MTILQTSSTRSTTSADLGIQRAQSGLLAADSAPDFESVLDAFTQSEPEIQGTDESSESEDTQPDDRAEESEDQGSTKATDSQGSETKNAEDSSPEPETQPVRNQEPELQHLNTHTQVSAEQIQSAADLGLLLTNAARINLADLAKLQLEGQPQAKPIAQTPAQTQSEQVPKDQSAQQLHQNRVTTPQTGESRSQAQQIDQSQNHSDPSVDHSAPTQTRSHESNSDQRIIVQSQAPQVVQAAQAVAPDAIRSSQPVRSQSQQNTVGVESARSITPADASNKSNTTQSGLDLGSRSLQSEKLAQSKSINDRPLMRREVMAQVQRGLASIMNTKGGTMRMRLNPDHLGDIKIELSTKDGEVRVKIEAANEDARTILKEGIEGLKHSMESRGVRVDDIRVNDPQPSAFDQMFKNADQDTSNTKHQQQEQGGQHHDQDALLNNETEDSETPRGIWTELGLDAIA